VLFAAAGGETSPLFEPEIGLLCSKNRCLHHLCCRADAPFQPKFESFVRF
jgi:hypothetical protein